MGKKQPKRPVTITKQLRAAIADSGLSVYALAKASGVPQATLQEFVSDDNRDLRLSNLDKLAAVLCLELRQARRKK